MRWKDGKKNLFSTLKTQQRSWEEISGESNYNLPPSPPPSYSNTHTQVWFGHYLAFAPYPLPPLFCPYSPTTNAPPPPLHRASQKWCLTAKSHPALFPNITRGGGGTASMHLESYRYQPIVSNYLPTYIT